MKLALLTITLILAGCGGSSSTNPLAVAADESTNVTQSDEAGQIGGQVTAPELDSPTPPEAPAIEAPVAIQPVRGECIDFEPINDGFGFDGVGTCITPIIQQPIAEVEPVIDEAVEVVDANEQAPEFTNLVTGERVILEFAPFSESDFTGKLWECVHRSQFNDFVYSYTSGSKGVFHRDIGIADFFQDFNGTGSATPVATNLPWSVSDGVYYGPFELAGQRWIEVVRNDGVAVAYRAWSSDHVFYECRTIETIESAAQVIEEAPVIFNPVTNEQIRLTRLSWDHSEISGQTLICYELSFIESSRNFASNPTGGGSRWDHFDDGTGHKLVFFGSGEPVSFVWGIEDNGDYKSDLSPLAMQWGEIVNRLDGRLIYRLWNITDPKRNHFECYFT